MSLSAEEIAFARELFADIPGLTTRRMFGGLGLYSEGTIFALMRSDGQILIKAVRGPFADRLADEGCTQWTYARKGGPETSMPYWTLPDRALDDPEEAASLARRALDALA